MIGKKTSHYKILEKLGEGGMGIVYKAQDTKLDRIVALKFLSKNVCMNSEEKKRFVHEAKAVAALDHNNICVIYEINETEENKIFIAMAYYKGETLKEKIISSDIVTSILYANKDKAGLTPSLPVKNSLDIFIQIAEGLSKAHKKEIIHRDIKSANIIITDEGIVKILDFGLAKFKGQTQLTQKNTTMGTVNYMSPEQAAGEDIDHRTDIWSLGVIMYEMITGKLPFQAQNAQAVIYSLLNNEPEDIKKLNPDVPDELVSIIGHALKKKRESRYYSAAEMIKDLKKYQESLKPDKTKMQNYRSFLYRIKKPVIAIPLLLFIIFIGITITLFLKKQSKIRWAKEKILPDIERLVELNWKDFTKPYNLAVQAEKIIPENPELKALFSKCSLKIDIKTIPEGAKVYFKDYQSPDSQWQYLGITPLEKARMAIANFRFKFEKEDYETVLAVSSSWNIGRKENFIPLNLVRVLDKKGNIPKGMVRVSGRKTRKGKLDDFFIDRYEVTNRQYREFILKGGYRNSEYWKHPIIKEGKSISWKNAIKEFVDKSGQFGPSIWEGGDFPEGMDKYPVSGISWYEAAAYAEFIGKSLPTVHHWRISSGIFNPMLKWYHFGGVAIFYPFSNFSGNGPVPTENNLGMTEFGAFDMAGNVREWCWNKIERGHTVMGGSWNEPSYLFRVISSNRSLDRSAKNGIRCVIYPDIDKLPETLFSPIQLQDIYLDFTDKKTDFYKLKPVSDDIFKVYREQFVYDNLELNPIIEWRKENHRDWIEEKISFDAAYGGERMGAVLFIPKNLSPPYQTLIYFPGSQARYRKSSREIVDSMEFKVFLSFILKNGRAVVYPVYKGTMERREDRIALANPATHNKAEFRIKLVKDFKRCVDYLMTRPDINSKKIAYYGMSWGSEWPGVIIPAIEKRIKVSILLAGGLKNYGIQRVHPINYVKRVKTPTLILNGKHDALFPYETSSKPLFDLLGTPLKHKKLILYDTDHIPPRNEVIKETLAWLDRYLGPVKRK